MKEAQKMFDLHGFSRVEGNRRISDRISSMTNKQSERLGWSVTILRHLLVWPSIAITCYVIYLVVTAVV